MSPKIPGTDGRKMSKSYNNYIGLDDSPEEIGKKVRKMITDPARQRRADKGHPDVCSIYTLYKVYFPDEVQNVAGECREAEIGCTDCKERLAARVAEDLAPFRAKRLELAKRPEAVGEILQSGADRVNPIVSDCLSRARSAMRIGTLWEQS
jgi:tryptophanyl-tRNA synthetase